jgi:hypothetical protein
MDCAGGLQVWTEVARVTAALSQMAYLSNSLLLSRTAAGQLGTAGRWPASGRRVAGVSTQGRGSSGSGGGGDTRLPADTASVAALAIINVTLVNFIPGGGMPNSSQPFFAFEGCGRCLQYQGAASALVSGLRFVQPGRPALAFWSWAQQVCMSCCLPNCASWPRSWMP